MRYKAVCLMFSIPIACASAQEAMDSVLYPEVSISSDRISQAIGSSVSQSDTALYELFKDQGICTLLELESFLSVREYSPGGIANFSIRGTGSQHTQVLWHGIPVNDPMLGQTDLSTVALNGTAQVRVLYGSAGLTEHSGGIGGTIELVPIMSRKRDGIDGSVSLFAGSFSNFGGSVLLNDRFRKVFGNTSASWQSAKNDFSFRDLSVIANTVRKLPHAKVRKWGLAKSLGMNINRKNTVTAHVSFSQDDRQLPPTMLMASTDELLLDRDIQTALIWKRTGGRSILNLTASYVYGLQTYTDNNGFIFKHRYQGTKELVRYQLNLGHHLLLNAGADVIAEHARSDSAYHESHWRQWQALFASLKYLPKKWLAAQVLLREDLIDAKFSPLQGLVGLELRPTQWLTFKGNVSRVFRAPTLNDRYWQPGGNSELKNEKGLSWEAGAVMRWKNPEHLISFSATYFQLLIDDWIIWLPEGNLWSPRNQRSVTSSGLASEMGLTWQIGRVKLFVSASYNWVRSVITEGSSANDGSVGKQLIYVPEHQAKGHLGIGIGRMRIIYGHSFTGQRFTTSDNSVSLPGYQVGWLSLSQKFSLQKHAVGVSITISNVFNKEYQTIAWRPMPGRSFLITLNYQFK